MKTIRLILTALVLAAPTTFAIEPTDDPWVIVTVQDAKRPTGYSQDVYNWPSGAQTALHIDCDGPDKGEWSTVFSLSGKAEVFFGFPGGLPIAMETANLTQWLWVDPFAPAEPPIQWSPLVDQSEVSLATFGGLHLQMAGGIFTATAWPDAGDPNSMIQNSMMAIRGWRFLVMRSSDAANYEKAVNEGP